MKNLLMIIVVSLFFSACGDGSDPYDNVNIPDDNSGSGENDVVTDGDMPDGYCDSHSDCAADERCDFETNRCVSDVVPNDYDKPDNDVDGGDEGQDVSPDDENDSDPDGEPADIDEEPDADEDTFFIGCGNGVIEEELGEVCDDGNTEDGDYCAADCHAVTGQCGDGTQQTNEACDDGNTEDGPYCSADCQTVVASCGDGIKQSNELCDDGNTDDGDYCSADCQEVTGACGDEVLQDNETCDEGEDNGKYGHCSNTCDGDGPHCGDGSVDGGFEVCDDGNTDDNDYCSFDCQEIIGRCGDTVVQTNEVCDDGNTEDGDYCSSDCQSGIGGCGDGTVQDNEDCDDGNAITETCEYGSLESCQVCNTKCTWQAGEITYCGDETIDTDNGELCDEGDLNGDYNHCGALCQGPGPYCGDGIADAGREACDDGNSTDNDYCSNDCQTAGECGDGTVQGALEECDDGNTVRETCDYGEKSCVVCNASCDNGPGKPNYCGDGNIDDGDGEVCDHGEANNGSYGYCKADCSAMGPVCGDGAIDSPNEVCDDGNDTDDDYCSNDCQTAGECGDGTVQSATEECDDSNTVTETCTYGATSPCTVCNDSCESVVGQNVFCGDGAVQGDHGEECDLGDANGTYDSGCDSSCKSGGPRCGDDVKQASETCDDGADNGTYNHCNTDCDGYMARCGDGTVDAGDGEVCDSGVDNSDSWAVAQHCNADCSAWAPYCGDDTIDGAHENCDDGADNGTYGYCAAGCQSLGSHCGDGTTDSGEGEECDDGNSENGDDCTNACTVNICGDGIRHLTDEECDDGNTETEVCEYDTSCQVCDAGCSLVAGATSSCSDGTLQRADCTGYEAQGCVAVTGAAEECDDGPVNGTYNHCNMTCTGIEAYCGDGELDIGNETCDDGNDVDNDYCTNDCQTEGFCSDGTVQSSEESCDDGSNNGTYGYCNLTCDGDMPRCGDGNVDDAYGEFCDDGDGSNSDAWSQDQHCNADCSDWAPYCGDETVDGPDEVCDGDLKNCGDIDASYLIGQVECVSDCSGYDDSTCGLTFIPDTGQTTCYNNTTSISCPADGEAFYGQDATYIFGVQGRSRRETVPDEPVITNTWFGYEWQGAVPDTTYTHADAVTYCNDLSYGSAEDWHLPESMLAGLSMDLTFDTPALDSTYFAEMPSAGFWTADSYDVNGYYLFDTTDGALFSAASDETYRVRCKRNTGSFYYSSDFTFSDDGAVVEESMQTGPATYVLQRTWESVPAGGTDNWENALAHCESLTLNGNSDWRLPDLFELASLIDIAQSNPKSSMPAVTSATYWSATTYNSNPEQSWIVDFATGYSSAANKDGSTHIILCVRDDR